MFPLGFSIFGDEILLETSCDLAHLPHQNVFHAVVAVKLIVDEKDAKLLLPLLLTNLLQNLH
jgi:hypothetical protein